MSAIVQVRHLRKQYDPPHGTVAVDDLSFEIEQGEVFSLLGPNGAGKTTTMSLLSCLLTPTSGEITVAGHSTRTAERQVKQIIGVVPQEIALYPSLSARENLEFWGRMYGLSGQRLRQRGDAVLEIAGLSDRADAKVKTFSGGMQRRLNIAVGLLHDPQVIYLDEPTVGIDPQSRRRILDTLKELNRQGLTVLYTTHYMEEAEELSHRIGIMDQGRLRAVGTLDSLKRELGLGYTVLLDVAATPPQRAALAQELERLPHARQVTLDTEQIALETDNVQAMLSGVLACIDRDALHLSDLQVREPTLETVFLQLTGRALRDA
ncbi:MAG TPA: ABC transporter ATP-binding protein [Roseiflexaceae bacterium]|nr:ABC transporter ATP-binding protein [Roseiflexaceae bacterium]